MAETDAEGAEGGLAAAADGEDGPRGRICDGAGGFYRHADARFVQCTLRVGAAHAVHAEVQNVRDSVLRAVDGDPGEAGEELPQRLIVGADGSQPRVKLVTGQMQGKLCCGAIDLSGASRQLPLRRGAKGRRASKAFPYEGKVARRSRVG